MLWQYDFTMFSGIALKGLRHQHMATPCANIYTHIQHPEGVQKINIYKYCMSNFISYS
jgi:hypothetical protein